MPPRIDRSIEGNAISRLQEAADQVSRQMGKWLLIEFSRKDKLPTLRFLVSPDNIAQATISRRKDGTLSYRLRDGSRQDNVMDDHQVLVEVLVRYVASMIVQTALENGPDSRRETLRELADPKSREEVYQEIRDKAQSRTARMCSTAIMPSGPRESHIGEFPTLPRRFIKTHFVDKDTLETADRIRPDNVQAYNFTLVNMDTIRRAQMREPHTADYFLRHALPWEKVDRDPPARLSETQYEDYEKPTKWGTDPAGAVENVLAFARHRKVIGQITNAENNLDSPGHYDPAVHKLNRTDHIDADLHADKDPSGTPRELLQHLHELVMAGEPMTRASTTGSKNSSRTSTRGTATNAPSRQNTR